MSFHTIENYKGVSITYIKESNYFEKWINAYILVETHKLPNYILEYGYNSEKTEQGLILGVDTCGLVNYELDEKFKICQRKMQNLIDYFKEENLI